MAPVSLACVPSSPLLPITAMTFDNAVELLARLTQKNISEMQRRVFEGMWNGKKYPDIAREISNSEDYVKQIGAELLRLLSKGLGEDVKKGTFKLAMMRYEQRQDISATPSATVCNNLPATDYQVLVGRENELSQLLEALSPEKTGACISVVGPGGIGKTALALAAAYWCLQTHPRQFDAIIFTSAKQQRFVHETILPRSHFEHNLHDIFRAIATTLKRPELLRQAEISIATAVLESLSQQRSLLIVDNLETIDDVESVLAFLHELPHTTKAIVTSRTQAPFPTIWLQPLTSGGSLNLMRKQADSKAITISADNEAAVLRGTHGIPAAIVYAVGQLATGYPITHIPKQLTLAGSDYCRFYFESSIAHLKENLSYSLLLALAMFAESATLPALADLVASSSELVIQALVQLQSLSLIHKRDERYSMLPLTRGYVLNELSARPELESQMRDRWIGWYLNFACTYGGKDWKDWHDFSEFEPEWDNLRDVIRWCIEHDRYDEVRQFWYQVKAYAHRLGYRGDRLTYWATGLDWTTWLMQTAKQRQDWCTALDVMADQSWTLTLLSELDRASQLYDEAWALRQHKDLEFQANLATHIAYLSIKQTRWEQAATWLSTAEALIEQVGKSSSEAMRSRIELAYYRGTLFYKTDQYNDAQQQFEEALILAQSINWQRAIYLAQDFLADIAIAQSQLIEAETLLTEGLSAAIANNDECRTAYCERSLARLEWQRDRRELALNYVAAAQRRFSRLAMDAEAQETANLLRQWASNLISN